MKNLNKKVFVICLIMAIFGFISLVSCKTQEPIVKEQEVIITKYEKELVRDTVIKVRIDSVFLQNNTKDTISKLITPLASSTAIWSNGQLYHSLSQGGLIKPTIQIKEIIKHDSVDKNNTITKVEYIEKPISFGTMFMIWTGRVFWCLFFLSVVVIFLRYKLKK